jgi:hypothetical protein
MTTTQHVDGVVWLVPLRCGTSEMATTELRGWTAQIVISSEHAGLRPFFKELEYEFRHVLARLDAPRDVRAYLNWLRVESSRWREMNANLLSRK